MQRINKYLAQCELGSRRKVEQLISNGEITINGTVCTDLSYQVKGSDVVQYKNNVVYPIEHKVVLMLNKPKGYITSLSDENNRHIVTELLIGIQERVFPVGRLDFNTEGLLLLTNNGELAEKITHPKFEISKTYEVIHDRKLTKDEKVKLENGVLIDGVYSYPAQIIEKGKNGKYFKTLITIHEGRNRIVRKLFASVHKKVINLKRIKIGNLTLGNLKLGEYKILNNSDIKKIFEK